MGVTVTLTGVEAVGVAGPLSVQIRANYSITHIRSAAYFARESGLIEREDDGSFNDDRIFRHRAHVVSTVITCVACLEASANELFADAADGHVEHLAPLGEATIALYARMWNRGVPRTARFPVLDKFAIALDLAGRESFDPGVTPYQELVGLIDIRNALVHYEPEWMSTGAKESSQGELHRLERRLKGCFPLSPFVGEVFTFSQLRWTHDDHRRKTRN